MSASCPKRASYTWQSIIHGRELLKHGLLWRVGDGRRIKVWEHNWIPRPSAQHPLGCQTEVRPQTVDELLVDGGGAWDEQKVRSWLGRRRGLVLACPSPGGGEERERIWEREVGGWVCVW